MTTTETPALERDKKTAEAKKSLATILIVEPNKQMREIILPTYLGNKGYKVIKAANGVQAAELMRASIPDLILIDKDVPIGGVRTARILRLHPKYRQIPIIITISPDKDEVLKLQKEVGKINLKAFLAVPSKRHYPLPGLVKIIQQNLKVELEEISLPDIREELKKLSKLPVLSPVHEKMLSLLAEEDTSINVRELVRTIESDQGLTTTILRVCSSAYYGFTGKAISAAITLLGMQVIRKIVHAAIVFNIFPVGSDDKSYGDFSILELWKHSVATGVIMEMSGSKARVQGRDHFIAGILHDIGKIVLYLHFPEHFKEIIRMVKKENKSMYHAEKELLGLTHVDIGHELAMQWKLPSTIATCIKFHHDPEEALEHKRLASLVHASDIVARYMNIGNGGDDQDLQIHPFAERISKNVIALQGKYDEVLAQVESIVPPKEG